MKCLKLYQFQLMKQTKGIIEYHKYIHKINKLIQQNILNKDYVFEYFGSFGTSFSLCIMAEFIKYYKPYEDFNPYNGIANFLKNIEWDSCFTNVCRDNKLDEYCTILFSEIDFDPTHNDLLLIALTQNNECIIKDIEIILEKYILPKLNTNIKLDEILNNYINKQWLFDHFYLIDKTIPHFIYNILYNIETGNYNNLELFFNSDNWDSKTLDKIYVEFAIERLFFSLFEDNKERYQNRFQIVELLLKNNCIIYTNNIFSSTCEISLIKNNLWYCSLYINSNKITDDSYFKLTEIIPEITKILYLLGDYGIYCINTKNGKVFDGSDIDFIDYDDHLNDIEADMKIIKQNFMIKNETDSKEEIYFINDHSQIYIENDLNILYQSENEDSDSECSDFEDSQYCMPLNSKTICSSFNSDSFESLDSLDISDSGLEDSLGSSPFSEIKIETKEIEKSQDLFIYLQNISIEYRNNKINTIKKIYKNKIQVEIVNEIILPYLNLG